MAEHWKLWIDTGGTFTDCVGVDPNGHRVEAKVLSTGRLRGRIADVLRPDRVQVDTNWDAADGLVDGWRLVAAGPDGCPVERRVRRQSADILDLDAGSELVAGTLFEVGGGEPAPIVAARLVTRTPSSQDLPPIAMRLATTRGTNALLERRGARIALITNEGLGDVLLIGNQQRPDLFAFEVRRPRPLYECVVEVRQRSSSDGSILRPLDAAHLREEARRLVGAGITTAAVALMHAYLTPEIEEEVAGILRECGITDVSCSSDLAPLIRIVPRGQTALVDAYLRPLVRGYLDEVERSIPGGRLHALTSAGSLVDVDVYRACDSLLSGPAGGVAGFAAVGAACGDDRLIGLDMGGTSTDVARFDRGYRYQFEHTVGGVTQLSPALAIETVAAGGGSICAMRHGRLTVGPQSAGAVPGPACYGGGGPLTLTDVNLLLGRLDVNQFEIPIDREPAAHALDELADEIERAGQGRPDRLALLNGLLAIADERMADAVRQISVREGVNPRDFALVAFGGAGGQHACAVADRLGIERVLMPRSASVLSAVGLGSARVERLAQRQVLRPLVEVRKELADLIGKLVREATEPLAADGGEDPRRRRTLFNLRLIGQDSTLTIEVDDTSDLVDRFTEQYATIYGTTPPHDRIEVESVRVIAAAIAEDEPGAPEDVSIGSEAARPTGHRMTAAGLSMHETPLFDRATLRPGDHLTGPALVTDRRSTCVIPTDWRAQVDGHDTLVVERVSNVDAPTPMMHAAVELELFEARFTAIAEEMGRRLERTALSTNVKERLDFSCTVLDSNGFLVANAPHMPVHLGAMGLCTRAVMEHIEMEPGDVIITNHPRFGGSHLPDITVITPVFTDDEVHLGYVASRAHHAELGGTRPGSMPPTACSLSEEGVVLTPMRLYARGVPRYDDLRGRLADGRYPSRSIDENIADVRAQVAASLRGAESLRDLAASCTSATVGQAMRALRERAERLTREAIADLEDGRYHAREVLDDGTPLEVRIDISGDGAVIDFAGSGEVHPGNLNATPAIVNSAVIYVLRLLIGERLPLNEGIMRAVDLRIPPGLLNPEFPDDPERCPAVVGGNVETSQRLVDTLLHALGLVAGSQGTMNNTLFGNERFGYYETVCGGTGAGPGFDGADAVHSHMTNTRLTDPEVLEHRYPARLERFAVRHGSGGAGRSRGGAGVIRELTFLEPVELSVVTQHRTTRPYALDGGCPGASGRQRVIRADGSEVELGPIAAFDVNAGDRLIMETPGGGGYGSPMTIDGE